MSKVLTSLPVGERVGIPWLARTCGRCPFCLNGRENLCDAPLFTGYTRDGGFSIRKNGTASKTVTYDDGTTSSFTVASDRAISWPRALTRRSASTVAGDAGSARWLDSGEIELRFAPRR